jgi:hypothetical protein
MAPTTAPRVLRIGIVRDGRIVEERLIRPQQPVSVGESTRNDFIFPPTHLPGRFQLFKPTRGGGYSLRLSGDMDGKVSFNDAVVPLAELRDSEARRVGGHWELPLPARARGKVVIDGITVLFQFVPAPPAPARAAASFRPRLWDEDDPVYFGFLGLHSALAALAMIFVYTRPPVDPLAVPEIPDRILQFAMTTPPDEPEELEELLNVDEDAPPQDIEEVADRVEEPDPTPPDTTPPAPVAGRLSDAVEQSSMARALGIGTTGEANNGRTIEDHFDGGGLYSDLDAFVREGEQLVIYEDGPTWKEGGNPGGHQDADIGHLEGADVNEVVVGDGPGGDGPKQSTFALGPPDDPSESSGTVAAVIRGNSGQLKACYESERKLNPSSGGRMVVWFELSETGRVVEVSVLENQTGSNGAFEACVTRRMLRWNFAPADVGTHTYPLVFTPT